MNLNIQNKEYKVEKLDNNARGIIKDNGKVIFIPKVCTGDIVNIDIVKEYDTYNEAVVTNYVKKDGKHVKPMCRYYYECGGCNLMHMSYEDSMIYKINNVIDIFNRFGIKINIDKINTSKSLGYRNKITLKVKDGMVGLYKEDTHELVEIDKCLICHEEINRVIPLLKNYNLKDIDEVVIRTNNKEVLVVLYSTDNRFKRFESLDVDSVVINNKNRYSLLFGEGALIQTIGNYKYKIISDSFYQVNNLLVKDLYDKVVEYLDLSKDDRVLDLYCGAGTIGIYLSSYVKEVLGVESNKISILSASYNSDLNEVDNIAFYNDKVSDIINLFKDINKVVVDPPRKGLDKKTIKYLKRINPSKIVYVSCNPDTLARDLVLLGDMYDIKDISLFDMFAYSYHVETICVLERK